MENIVDWHYRNQERAILLLPSCQGLASLLLADQIHLGHPTPSIPLKAKEDNSVTVHFNSFIT